MIDQSAISPRPDLTHVEQRLVDSVDAQDVVLLLQELVRADSTHDETQVADILERELTDAGMSCTRTSIGGGRTNLVATAGRPGGQRRLIFNAHMDTVPAGARDTWSFDPFGGEIVGKRLYGRGSSDDKGGVAGMASAALALQRANVPLDGELLLTFVGGETQGNLGTRALAQAGLQADFAIIGEYSEADKIAIAYRGAIWGRLLVSGSTAHPGRPHLGADALAASLDVLLPLLRGHRFDFEPHPLLPDPQLTVTRIQAGHSKSMLADRLVADLDIRLLPGQDEASVWDELEAAVTSAQLPRGIAARLEKSYGLNGFETPKNQHGVAVLRSVLRDLGHPDPPLIGKVGMCDGNVLVNDLNIPSIAYGPGNPSGTSADEFCDVDALWLATRAYALTAFRFLTNASIQEEN